MRLRSVAVLGGGPGGLYAARLLKLRRPETHVEVHEQGRRDLTFGFGVGLATKTQRNLQAADPATLADIVEASWTHDMSMSVAGHRVRLGLDNLLAIGRSTLLGVLQRHAVEAGVELHFGSRRSAEELDADLVIAADGVSSATREQHAAELGATVDQDHDHYLWCGTEFALPTAVFSPISTPAGTFVAHAYPYAADRSTFLVETDAATWQRAGFEETTAATPLDASDEQSLAYLSEAFAEELQGHRLIGNRTRWTQFRTVRCRRWHTGRTVLLGDAAHTAHYSIGSGTKLAMEDAIALDRALDEADTLESALASYEMRRRPDVDHLQQTALRSMRWWHTFPDRLDLPVEQLFISYMSRAGKVTLDRFAQTAPDVVRAGLAAYAGTEPEAGVDPIEWTLAQPWIRAPWSAPTRHLSDVPDLVLVDRVGDPAQGGSGPRLLRLTAGSPDQPAPHWEALLVDTRKALEADCAGVLLGTSDDLDSVLTLLESAERIRLETGAIVAVRAAPRWREHVTAGLASGRVDLVDLTPDGEVA